MIVALPVALATGSAVADILCVLIGIAFLVHSFAESDFRWLCEAWMRVLGLLWIYTIARALASGSPLHSAGVALSWFRFVLLAAAGTWVLRDEVWRQRLLVSTASVCGFLAADALFQAMAGFDVIGRPILSGRLTATMSRPRLGITLAWLFLPAALGLLQSGWIKMAAVLVLGCLSAILLSGDRLAFLIAVTGLGLAVVSLQAVRRQALMFAGGLAIVVCGVLFARPDVYARQIESTAVSIKNLGQTHYGVIWSRALVMARANPVFGVGMDLYRDYCADPRYGEIEKSDNNLPACEIHPHNIYLEWLVENGALGLAGFAAAVGLIFWRVLGAWPSLRGNYVFLGLVVTLGLRFFPLSTSTGFTRAWYGVPLWLFVGWALACAGPTAVSRNVIST